MVIKEIAVGKDINSRDCALFVQHAMRYNSEILLEFDTKKINCKSVMGMISLGLKIGDKVIMIIKGDDEENAAGELALLFSSNFR